MADIPAVFQLSNEISREEASAYLRDRLWKQNRLQEPRRGLEKRWAHFPEGIEIVQKAGEAAEAAFWYRKGAPYLLTPFDLVDLMIRSDAECEVTGIPFNDEMVPGCKRRPFIPSIDRINPKEPYRFENCRLVCWVVNRALGDWGDDVFWRMVRAASERI